MFLPPQDPYWSLWQSCQSVVTRWTSHAQIWWIQVRLALAVYIHTCFWNTFVARTAICIFRHQSGKSFRNVLREHNVIFICGSHQLIPCNICNWGGWWKAIILGVGVGWVMPPKDRSIDRSIKQQILKIQSFISSITLFVCLFVNWYSYWSVFSFTGCVFVKLCKCCPKL